MRSIGLLGESLQSRVLTGVASASEFFWVLALLMFRFEVPNWKHWYSGDVAPESTQVLLRAVEVYSAERICLFNCDEHRRIAKAFHGADRFHFIPNTATQTKFILSQEMVRQLWKRTVLRVEPGVVRF